MNCELSRLRIALGAEGRAGEGADEFAAHLHACPSCAGIAARESAFDSALARAINDVPLPAGLHDRILKSAYARRGTALRRTAGRTLALAAAVAVAFGIGAGAYWRNRPTLDTDSLAIRGERERESAEETVHNWLAKRDLPGSLPLDFEYRFHSFHGKGELGETEVPVVVFQRGHDFARVYIVKEFNLDTSKIKDAQSSLCKVNVIRSPTRPDVTYVILYTTDTLDPFLRQNLMPIQG